MDSTSQQFYCSDEKDDLIVEKDKNPELLDKLVKINDESQDETERNENHLDKNSVNINEIHSRAEFEYFIMK